MQLQREQSLHSTRQYLYEKFKELPESGNHRLSNAYTQQIRALSSYNYTPITKGSISSLFRLLKKADIADTAYDVKGCTIWMPYGVRYKKQFILQLGNELESAEYDEYHFPGLVEAKNFATLCDEIYDFNDQVLRITSHNMEAILKPTGESTIYPVFARWLREGKALPLRAYQAGSFHRYKSSPHPYLRPVECTFMLEAHGAFATSDEMQTEYDAALKICERWVRLLCFDPYVVSRPVAFNRPVSIKTVGFDVLLPNGKTMQTAIAYLQSQIFSKPYNVTFYDKGERRATEQITFGITERNIYTSLFVHADDLGLRLPSKIAPEQIRIICRETSPACQKLAESLRKDLNLRGVRSFIVNANNTRNVFASAVIKGIPLQIIIDDRLIKRNLLELFDRRDSSLSCLELTAGLPQKLQSILSDGDEILIQEQTIRKNESTQVLSVNDVRQSQALDVAKKHCFQVNVHENNDCIDELQTIGLGEYIGTDQAQDEVSSLICYSCGKSGGVIGYLTKRL